jgi:Ser/Thr protein kinase RdoA (MazF antagonist)
MQEFDWEELSLIEPLRALRIIHYSAWILRRWEDPCFPTAFPIFGSAGYWRDEIEALSEILNLMNGFA